jgi:hypothetical protein
MILSLEQLCQGKPEWEKRCEQLRSAPTLSEMVWIALQMALYIARMLLEKELENRAKQPVAWGNCSKCGW